MHSFGLFGLNNHCLHDKSSGNPNAPGSVTALPGFFWITPYFVTVILFPLM